MIRGIRGATTVTQDDADEILNRTAELLLQMAEQNAVQ
ncbi:MAG: chorismate mutase, partial [Sulfobacillus sp.]|nr:chorismate mutase [Sulfobacillus sp.]